MRVYDYVNVSPYKNWIDPLPTFQEAAYPPFARGPRLTAAYRRLSPVSAAGATRHRGRAHVGGGFPPIPPPPLLRPPPPLRGRLLLRGPRRRSGAFPPRGGGLGCKTVDDDLASPMHSTSDNDDE